MQACATYARANLALSLTLVLGLLSCPEVHMKKIDRITLNMIYLYNLKLINNNKNALYTMQKINNMININ